MRTFAYIARRFLLLVPQAFLIVFVTFVLIRLLPGDVARLELGPLASNDAVEALRKQMKLDQSLPVQFVAYLDRVFHGDLGRSWVNSSSVTADLRVRLPATLELIGLGLIVMLVVLIPLGIITASRRGGLVTRALKRVASGYGLLAGAFPDFWLGLLLIFIFFTKLKWFPGPEGRLSIGETPPHHITGSYVIDSILTGNTHTLGSAIRHLVLPVFTLAFVYGAAVYKYTWSRMSQALRSDFTTYAEALGMSPWRVSWYAFRVAAPPVIVIVGVTCGFLLGGAVLIETVFNLNGIGQYAVQSIISSDYAPTQGFVLVAAIFTMLVYLIVDLILFTADPRVRGQASTTSE